MNPNGMSGTVHIQVCTGGIGHQEVKFHIAALVSGSTVPQGKGTR